MCDRQDQLVGYVYDELSPRERREVDGHLVTCAECRSELAGLQMTRTHLAEWTPPEPDLGFRVIRGGSAPAPALPRRFRLAPAAAFAAAAVIVLAVAGAIANVEVRYGGITVRTGWGAGEAVTRRDPPVEVVAVRPTTPESPGTIRTVAAAAPASVDASVLATLEQRLGELEASLAARPVAAASRASDAELLRRVREIVSEAEARQQVALAQGLVQVLNDFDRQRRADLAAMQQGIGQYQGLANAEIAQTRDMVNQLIRVAKQER